VCPRCSADSMVHRDVAPALRAPRASDMWLVGRVLRHGLRSGRVNRRDPGPGVMAKVADVKAGVRRVALILLSGSEQDLRLRTRRGTDLRGCRCSYQRKEMVVDLLDPADRGWSGRSGPASALSPVSSSGSTGRADKELAGLLGPRRTTGTCTGQSKGLGTYLSPFVLRLLQRARAGVGQKVRESPERESFRGRRWSCRPASGETFRPSLFGSVVPCTGPRIMALVQKPVDQVGRGPPEDVLGEHAPRCRTDVLRGDRRAVLELTPPQREGVYFLPPFLDLRHVGREVTNELGGRPHRTSLVGEQRAGRSSPS